MSSVTSSANRWWTFNRQTAFIVDTVSPPASPLVFRQPLVPSYMQITSSGNHFTPPNAVSFFGTDRSGATITWGQWIDAAGTVVGTQEFATLTNVTTSGWGGVGTVGVKAVSADGTTNLIQYAVAANRPVVYATSGAPKWPALTQGTSELNAITILVDYEEVWKPRVGDIGIDNANSDEWDVLGVREVVVGFAQRPHHYALSVARRTT